MSLVLAAQAFVTVLRHHVEPQVSANLAFVACWLYSSPCRNTNERRAPKKAIVAAIALEMYDSM
jgi:hypothetical protein